jgi:hypothetical protein
MPLKTIFLLLLWTKYTVGLPFIGVHKLGIFKIELEQDLRTSVTENGLQTLTFHSFYYHDWSHV